MAWEMSPTSGRGKVLSRPLCVAAQWFSVYLNAVKEMIQKALFKEQIEAKRHSLALF